jgi:hypothetical protein
MRQEPVAIAVSKTIVTENSAVTFFPTSERKEKRSSAAMMQNKHATTRGARFRATMKCIPRRVRESVQSSIIMVALGISMD